jgi:4-oxalocrotonate tautomerase
MPVITVAAPEGVYDQQGKAALIREITEAVVRVGGEHERRVTRVLFQDYPEGTWGSAGEVYRRKPAPEG